MGRSPLSPNRSTWPNLTVSCYLLWRAEKAIDDGLALSTSLLVPFTDRLWIVDRRATQRTARGVEEGAQALRSPGRATAAPTCGPWRRDPIPTTRITATPRNLICEPPGRAALPLSAA